MQQAIIAAFAEEAAIDSDIATNDKAIAIATKRLAKRTICPRRATDILTSAYGATTHPVLFVPMVL